MNPKSLFEKAAFKKLHPNWGGGKRNQGRKPRRRTYRRIDGRWLTVAEMKTMDAAMERLDYVPIK